MLIVSSEGLFTGPDNNVPLDYAKVREITL